MEGMKKNRVREAGNGVKMGREPRGPLEGLGAKFFAEGKSFVPRPSSMLLGFLPILAPFSRETGAIFQLILPIGPPLRQVFSELSIPAKD